MPSDQELRDKKTELAKRKAKKYLNKNGIELKRIPRPSTGVFSNNIDFPPGIWHRSNETKLKNIVRKA